MEHEQTDSFQLYFTFIRRFQKHTHKSFYFPLVKHTIWSYNAIPSIQEWNQFCVAYICTYHINVTKENLYKISQYSADRTAYLNVRLN